MENKKFNIVLDAMGGDKSVLVNIEGAVMALTENNNIIITLIGKEDEILNELKKHNYDKDRIKIINATEVITNEDTPTSAIRNKKNSSIVIGLNLLKKGECDGFVSSGSTGAVLTGATLIVGRIKGIQRPALGTIIPNKKGFSFLIDAGANVDAKPEYLVQFASMGSAYMESIMGIKNPRVGLINIGVEEEKGNALTKEAYVLLKQSKINFIGNVEARDISHGVVDVMVCDAFVGNVILKYTEGFAEAFMSIIKKELTSKNIYKAGAFLAKGAFENLKKIMSYEEYGGAPLLGLKALVVKAHGSSSPLAIKNAINQCYLATKNNLVEKIASNM